MTQNVDDLAKRVKDAREAYYNGSPIMSDAAYDAIEDQLRLLNPNHPVLTGVGAAPSGGWAKVQHTIPMGSLGKAQHQPDQMDPHAEVRAWAAKVSGELLHLSEKLDGISINLVYKDHKLVQAVTRGDGLVGEDITRNVLLMQGAVKVLPKKVGHYDVPPALNVRGEIVVTKTDFATHFQGESNPRNTASGTAKRQSDPGKCRYLTIMAYQVLPEDSPLPNKESEFATLSQMGFKTPYHTLGDVDTLLGVYQQYVDSIRDSLDYEIDGLVIEINDTRAREKMGSHNMKPKGAIAYKFPHAQKPSVLRDIMWQVGASGRVTPVAVFDTVNLAGANVSNASLHNLANIARLVTECDDPYKRPMGVLAVGDQIMVARRGDVIPYVEELLVPARSTKSLNTPDQCPECSTPLNMDGEYLVCPGGEACPAQVVGAIKRWVTKLDVKHFGTALIEALCASGRVATVADLYRCDPNDVATNLGIGGRVAGGSATKAFRNLHAKKVLPLATIVGSLGIPLIGRSMAQTIVDGGFDSLNAMSKATVTQIAAIPGVGHTKAKAFVDGIWDKMTLITDLLSVGVTVEKPFQAANPGGPFKGEIVRVTGTRDKDLMQAILDNGAAEVKDSGVSKKVTLLVAADPNSTSGKAKKARDYGIPIIGVDEAWAKMGK